MTERKLSDDKRMEELALKYDIVNLGGIPPRSERMDS